MLDESIVTIKKRNMTIHKKSIVDAVKQCGHEYIKLVSAIDCYGYPIIVAYIPIMNDDTSQRVWRSISISNNSISFRTPLKLQEFCGKDLVVYFDEDSFAGELFRMSPVFDMSEIVKKPSEKFNSKKITPWLSETGVLTLPSPFCKYISRNVCGGHNGMDFLYNNALIDANHIFHQSVSSGSIGIYINTNGVKRIKGWHGRLRESRSGLATYPISKLKNFIESCNKKTNDFVYFGLVESVHPGVHQIIFREKMNEEQIQ